MSLRITIIGYGRMGKEIDALGNTRGYTIVNRLDIHNNALGEGLTAETLLRRHWLITDANCKVQEVRGEGVVGVQPHIMPGESYEYTSAAILETPVGCMQGSYEMIADDGMEFDAPIPVFNLAVPNTLH